MRILSFDIGIYNLAYAALEVPEVPKVPEVPVSEGALAALVTDKQDTSLRTKILDWGILSLASSEPGISGQSRRLIELLFETFADPYDVVLIENQPCMKNPTMKSIQMMVYTFFMMRNHMEGLATDVKFVSAANKLKVKHKGTGAASVTSSTKYGMNKKLVVEYAKNYLELTKDLNGSWIPVFMKEKKKDDLADSYAQGLHFIENMS